MGNAMTANAPADKAINSALMQMQLKTAHSFEIGGHAYQCKALLPLEQVHLARRLAPLILGALKPESGRTVILQRLAKVAGIGTDDAASVPPAEMAEAAMDLATGILEAAASIDEESVNTIIRTVMSKIWRADEAGIARQVWWTRPGLDQPTYPDIDGFMTLAIVGRYLTGEFKDRIAEYVASLSLKAGPAFAAAMAQEAPVASAAPAGPVGPLAEWPLTWENGQQVPISRETMAAAGRA